MSPDALIIVYATGDSAVLPISVLCAKHGRCNNVCGINFLYNANLHTAHLFQCVLCSILILFICVPFMVMVQAILLHIIFALDHHY